MAGEPGTDAPGPGLRWADLVLEGGGVKGIGLVGAVTALEEAGYRFRRVAGCSAGSIVGAFIAAGLSAAELTEVMDGLDYRRLGDPTRVARIPIIGPGLSLWRHQGVHEGEVLRRFVADHLADVGVRTFADLRDDDPESSLPEHLRYRLIAHVSDITRSRLLRLPWDYRDIFGLDPDRQGVADCVRASSSIPFFFTPSKLAPRVGAESWLVDGGAMSGFPVEVFDRTDGQTPRWPTIGIRLSHRSAPDAVEHHVHDLVSFGQGLAGSLTGWYDRMSDAEPGAADRTIYVDTFGIKATDLDIGPADKARLFASGRAAAEAWLARHPKR
jgi:NTE family protein